MADRRERVILELSDSGFSTGMVKNAAATGLLQKALKSLDGTNVVVHERISESATQVDRLSKSSDGADRSINQLTGRLRLFADAAAILGPALVPLGGVAVAGIAGLSAQMGFAAIAGGVLIGSMQGLGDALGALNEARLDPTRENLMLAEDALNRLSPAAANFAREASGMIPALTAIRDMGSEALFPGLTESLEDLERLAPVVGRIFEAVGGALGDIASDSAASLASERWSDFFEFIATEAPTALSELATTVGSLTHGLAELWMAMTPLNNDFSSWLMDVAAGFDSWATGLAGTDGFAEFVSYIRTTGPQVSETLGALANAIVQIVTAAAPLGGPTLMAIEAFADAIALLADSGLATPLLAAASAMAIFTRGAGLMAKATTTGLASLNPWAIGIGATAGLLLAIEAKADAAAAGVGRFNDAIAAGNLAEANAGIEDMQARLDELQGTDMASISFSSFGNLLDGKSVQDEIDETTKALGGSAEQVRALETELSRAAASDAYKRSIQEETDALYENIAAMQSKRDEALRSFSAQTNYSQSLLDSQQALEENGRAWNLNTEAGLKNRRAVEAQASSWNELNRTQGQTPAQARKARAALEETAVSLGATKEQARQYARQLMDIPSNLKTKIAADAGDAFAEIDALEAKLRSIRDEDVFINVRQIGSTTLGPRNEAADGGTVPKTGKPYADRHLYLLADGEEVISNRHGQADRHRTLLKSINGGLADGGTAGDDKKRRKSTGSFFAADNSSALQASIDRLTMVSQNQSDAIDSQMRAVEDSTEALEFWGGKMGEVAKATVSGFDTDLFAKDSNPWAAGAGGGPLSNLTGDIDGLNERSSLQAQLSAAGLSGDALAAILSQGTNSDLQGILTSGTAGSVQSAFDQRAALQGVVGAAGGQLTFGAEFASAEATNRDQLRALSRQVVLGERLELEIVRLNSQMARNVEAIERMEKFAPDDTANALADRLDGAAAKAQRDRKNRGSRVG